MLIRPRSSIDRLRCSAATRAARSYDHQYELTCGGTKRSAGPPFTTGSRRPKPAGASTPARPTGGGSRS